MEGLTHVWEILFTAALATFGFALRYLFMKTQTIMTEDEIRQIIKDSAAPESVKQVMIYERLVHIERKLDRLMEERHKDDSYKQ